MGFEVSSIKEPVGAVGVSCNTVRVYVPNLGRTVGKSGREDDQSSCDTKSRQRGNPESCESQWRRHGHLFRMVRSQDCSATDSHGFYGSIFALSPVDPSRSVAHCFLTSSSRPEEHEHLSRALLVLFLSLQTTCRRSRPRASRQSAAPPRTSITAAMPSLRRKLQDRCCAPD